MKKKNLIKIDLSGCKNWKEAQKVIEMIASGKIKITSEKLSIASRNQSTFI